MEPLTKTAATESANHVLPAEVIKTSAELWRVLVTSAGLDEKQYDAKLVADLRRELGFPSDEPIDRLLKARSTSLEDFIPAFFRAVEPYARMMSDLLAMFEAVAAKRTDRTLGIAYDFGNPSSNLDFSLEHFRAWQRRWEKLSALVPVSTWNHNTLWMLNGAFREPFQESSSVWQEQESVLETQAPYADWFRIYRSRKWPVADPPMPDVDDETFNALLRRAWQVWSAVVRESRLAASDREALREIAYAHTASEEPSEGRWSVRMLWQIDSDLWMESFLRGLIRKIELIRNAGPERASLIAMLRDRLESVFRSVGQEEVLPTVMVEKLEEFLDLPIWRYRHELYSAWVMTQIRDAIGAERLQVHVADGRLSFSFGGSHLGSVPDASPPYHLWAELRTPHAKLVGKGRKASVQPDYSLVASPVTDPGSTLLVVECKQYLKASTRNFRDALIDYARARPRATVVLASYGPGRPSILDGVPLDLRGRTILISNLRPGSPAAAEEFRDALQRILPGSTAVLPASGTSVGLSWGATPEDLDLHLRIGEDGTAEEVSFRNPGSAEHQPWAQLDRDDRDGNGSETIEILRFMPKPYRFAVHDFDEGNIAGCGASVLVQLAGQTVLVECPCEGRGSWWDVLEIHGASRAITIRNSVRSSPPWP